MIAAQENQEFRNALLRGIVNASPEGILVVNRDNRVVSVNRQFFTVWAIEAPLEQGLEVFDVSDTPILAAVLDRVHDPEAFLARVRELYENPDIEDHCELSLLDGRTLERNSSALRSRDGDYLGRVWYFRDISQHKKMQANLRELAETDPLTGLWNRRKFYERAGDELQRVRRNFGALSLIALDIDHFKAINDRWGHSAGDRVLQSAGQAWREALRSQDTVARMGGEEFAVLLPDTAGSAALETAERLRDAFAWSVLNLSQGEISCTVSAGVAELAADDASIDACLNRADAALYLAKNSGRNQAKLAA